MRFVGCPLSANSAHHYTDRSSLIPLQRLSFNIKANYLTVSVAQCMYDMGLDKDNGYGIAKVEGREAWHLTEVILSVNFINPVIPFSKFAQRCFQLRQVYIYLGLYSGTFSSSIIHPPPPTPPPPFKALPSNCLSIYVSQPSYSSSAVNIS